MSSTEFFEAASPRLAKLLVHGRNRGKGAALKTGFAWIRANQSGTKGVVTADADGQHTVADITRVAEAVAEHPGGLVLGVRRFNGHVPFRSRFGNYWTMGFFWLITGLAVKDTQTGLRGIPRDLLDRVANLPGDRYEYETNVLLNLRQFGIPYTEVTIRTVYEDGNAASHKGVPDLVG